MVMNKLFKMLLCGALLAFVLSSCQISDAERDYGFPLIYIPQATITGLDNTYPIPFGPIGQNSTYSCKYNEKNGTLDIALGVIRAGAIKNAKGFSVSLGVSEEQTQRKLDEYTAKSVSAIALPISLCDIPQKINVERGKNSGTCYVSVDFEELSTMSISDSGKYSLLVLGLQISEPTEYELAEENTSVVIVIDLNSSYWDDLAENLPESVVRDLFPIL